MTSLLLIFLAALITYWRFRRGTGPGLAAAVFFLVLMPTEVRLPLPGALPEVTVHRVLLIVCATQTLLRRSSAPGAAAVAGFSLLTVVALTRIVSTANAIDFVRGIKDSLAFMLETFLFYYIVASSLKDRQTVLQVLWGALYGLIAIALIATVEKYRGINLAARLVPGMPDFGVTVTATFRHRIMLGYAMAMGFGLVVAMRSLAASRLQKIAANVGILLLPAACYFANSRGPWVGAALAGGVMLGNGNRVMRKRMIWLLAATVLVLVLRPGVYTTIQNRWEQTQSTDTLKGRSASYRLELWKVAYRQVTKSFDRLLFGYGGQSTELMQLGEEFQFGGGSSALGYTSWDSEYAADLVKYGAIGLIAELAVYGFVMYIAVMALLGTPSANRALPSACVAVIGIFLWAMSNVSIFNPQLTYLFWTVVAVSAALLAELKTNKQTVRSVPEALPRSASGVAPAFAR